MTINRRPHTTYVLVCQLPGCGIQFQSTIFWRRFCCDAHKTAFLRLRKKEAREAEEQRGSDAGKSGGSGTIEIQMDVTLDKKT